jgi:hypothetical protein
MLMYLNLAEQEEDGLAAGEKVIFSPAAHYTSV